MGNRKHFWCVEGDKIVNRYDVNEVLDVKGANRDNLAELCGWKHSGNVNQRWHIEYV